MSKRLIGVLGATLLLFSLSIVAFGQTVTKVQTVQNADGTYTIVEYPVGKETIVNLNPIGLSGAKDQATILRPADGTTIKVPPSISMPSIQAEPSPCWVPWKSQTAQVCLRLRFL